MFSCKFNCEYPETDLILRWLPIVLRYIFLYSSIQGKDYVPFQFYFFNQFYQTNFAKF